MQFLDLICVILQHLSCAEISEESKRQFQNIAFDPLSQQFGPLHVKYAHPKKGWRFPASNQPTTLDWQNSLLVPSGRCRVSGSCIPAPIWKKQSQVCFRPQGSYLRFRGSFRLHHSRRRFAPYVYARLYPSRLPASSRKAQCVCKASSRESQASMIGASDRFQLQALGTSVCGAVMIKSQGIVLRILPMQLKENQADLAELRRTTADRFDTLERGNSSPFKESLQEERRAFIYIVSTKQYRCMANPDLDSGIVYNEQGFIHILHSTFFEINPRIDYTVEEYVERILDTFVEAIEEQLGNVQWHIASDPQQG
ncbi:hypothetical protein M5K25_020017 [Dendrobium thyrsiflorum]|uniref:Uncharacterized protein n=1 Tax=Dendrobium thyrsiflorum TaxID=117978 RepID=A0ABD0UFL9_DENTH